MEFSVVKWHELCLEMERFEEEFSDRFSCEPEFLTTEKIKSSRCREALLGDWVLKFAAMYHDTKSLTSTAAAKIEELNSALVKGQEKVIALQEDVIRSNEEQLAGVQSAVRDEMVSVQTAVKTGFSSWSKVVQQNAGQPICPAKLKEAVKSAVVEEDRSRNIMIFGKEEKSDEDLSQTISKIFEDVKEKPGLIEFRRIGIAKPGKPRPIKVKLSSSDAVFHVLRKAKDLKSSDTNRSTYIGPDRTKEEREAHKHLVGQLKTKIKKESEMYHYIKGGRIISKAK